MATENVGAIEYTIDANVRPLLDANKRVDRSLDTVDGALNKTSSGLKKYDRAANDAGGGASKFAGRMTLVAARVNVAVAAIAGVTAASAAAIAAFAAIANSAAGAAREIENMALLSNTTIERFQELSFGAQTVGVSAEKLGDIFKDVQDKIGDFIATGGGELADYFENVAPLVGQTAEEFQYLSGPDALIAFQKGLDAANLSAAEQVFYLESIANDAALLRPLLKDNAKGFEDAAKRANELNVVLSATEIKELSALKSEFDALFTTVGKVTQKIVSDFAPSLISALQSVVRFVGAAGVAVQHFFDLFQDPESIDDIDTLEKRLKTLTDELDRIKRMQAVSIKDMIDLNSLGGSVDLRSIEEVEADIKAVMDRIRELGGGTKIPDVTSGAEQESKKKYSQASLSIFDTPAGQSNEDFSNYSDYQLSSSGKTKGDIGISQANLDLQEGIKLSEEMARRVETIDQKFMDLGTTMADTLVDAAYSFADAAGTGIVDAISAGEDLDDTFKKIAQTVTKQVLASLITMGIQYGINAALKSAADTQMAASGAAAMTATTAAAATNAAALSAAWAPAAAGAAIATAGGAAVAGGTALTTTYGIAQGLSATTGLAGGRLNGGPVSAGSMYEVNENGKPEMLTIGNKQMLMMGRESGTVTSNKDLTSSGGGSNVVINITNNASGTDISANEGQMDGKRVIDIMINDVRENGKFTRALTENTTANYRAT